MRIIQVGGQEWERYDMPPKEAIQQSLHTLIQEMFSGKKPAVDRRPVAIITMGVQGAGKSTAIKKHTPSSFVLIDPDRVTNALLGKRPLPDDGPVFSLSNVWTHKLIQHAIEGNYDFIYDTALPSTKTLAAIKRKNYIIKMILVHTIRHVAREREVARDLKRGWGRPGIGVRSHLSGRDSIAKYGPRMVTRYVDELTVCDNSGRVMKCAKCPLDSRELESLFRM